MGEDGRSVLPHRRMLAVTRAGYFFKEYVTGRETFVFSCFNQDQDMDRVDFANLAARLRQNTVQEKLSTMWLDHLLSRESQRRV